MKAIDYVVYRVGGNAANQMMTFDPCPIGIYSGAGATSKERIDDAIRQACEEHSVYNNQYLTAKPCSRCSQEDLMIAHEVRESVLALRERYDRGEFL